MKTVDSDALTLVQLALGLTGSGAQQTQLTDGELLQTLDVANIVRRSRTQAATTGLYTAVMRNNHGAADTQSTTVDPYNVTTGAIAPYPVPIPRQFDVWVMSAAVRQISGTGTLTATLLYDYPAASQGWGLDQAGVAVVSSLSSPIAWWDGAVTQVATFATQGGEAPWIRLGLRIRPGGDLIFSSTSTAISAWECQLLIGVFPVALGQDVLT